MPRLTPAERELAITDAELIRRRLANLNRFLNSDRLGPMAHELARTQRDELATELRLVEDALRYDGEPQPQLFGRVQRAEAL